MLTALKTFYLLTYTCTSNGPVCCYEIVQFFSEYVVLLLWLNKISCIESKPVFHGHNYLLHNTWFRNSWLEILLKTYHLRSKESYENIWSKRPSVRTYQEVEIYNFRYSCIDRYFTTSSIVKKKREREYDWLQMTLTKCPCFAMGVNIYIVTCIVIK